MIQQKGPLPESNFTAGRDGTKVDRIVIHWMAGWIAGADARFKNPASKVSAHYGVRTNGELWQWVDEDDTAYHAGNWEMNLRSIGIEHESFADLPPMPALYEASSQLVADIALRYSIPLDREHVVQHKEIVATACPGLVDIDVILTRAKSILAAKSRYAVLGPTQATLDQLRSMISTRNPAATQMADLYWALAPQAGIRAEVALAQALKETNYFMFGGDAEPEWHNPAGLGVTGAPGAGNRFPDWETGVKAQLGHLLWYLGPHKPEFCDVDQRHFGGHKNLPNDVRQLNGKWAVPGVGYGESIANIADAIMASPAKDFWARGDQEAVTWGDLKEYSRRLQGQLNSEFVRK